jgi:hypothetical protein
MTDTVQNLDLRWIRGKTDDWSKTIRQVELLAAELMLKDEKTWKPDDENLEWCINFIHEAGQLPHGGDCPVCRAWLTAPITCDACVYDEYMLKAWAQKRETMK